MKNFNTDYATALQEGSLIKKCASRIRRIECNNGHVLIVVPCLIGDFIATVPAIADFIERHPGKVFDIVVTSHLAPLVERMNGIRHIFIAQSMVERGGEAQSHSMPVRQYETVMILRASKNVLNNIAPYLEAGEVVTKIQEVIKYTVKDLLKNNLRRRLPTQWREFSFHVLNGTPRKMRFDQIFTFTKEDYTSNEFLRYLSKDKINIIIHTGASWHMNFWPLERWVDLLAALGGEKYNFLFIGAGKDKRDYEYIISRIPFPARSLIGQTNLRDMMILFSKAQLFLGIDSGPGNIAHLAGLPSVVIYGPGPHTFMSDLEGDIKLDKSNGKGIYQRFFRKEKGFIHKITVEEVYYAVKKIETSLRTREEAKESDMV